MMESFYDLVEIKESSSQEEIKKAIAEKKTLLFAASHPKINAVERKRHQVSRQVESNKSRRIGTIK
jgi:DnaJ-class molecular chaperone